MAARFSTSTSEERQKLVDDAIPANTKKATNTWVRAFSVYCGDKPLDLESCSEQEFAKCLEGFYADLRKQDGSCYKRASYIAARGALQRHLTAKGRPFKLYTGEAFVTANKILDGVLKNNKRLGLEDSVQHKEAINDADWSKIKDYFRDAETSTDPVLLCRYAWFILSIHFCLRGREIQCQMKKDDLVFSTDENSVQTVTLSKDFVSKNHQGGLSGSAFSSLGCIQDPVQVATLSRYISFLSPKCDRLFQRALLTASPGASCLYMNMPLSHNLLGRMMMTISEAASLSKKYTNHCARATAICRMKAANVEDRKICAVSGHKSAQSLQSYDRVSSSDVRAMSNAIDGCTDPVLSSKSCSSDSPAAKPEPNDLEHCAKPVSSASESLSSATHASDSSASSASAGSGVVLHNCQNVTFNVQNSWLRPQKRSFPFSLKLNKKARK